MNIQTFESPADVAETAAQHAVDTLHDAITTHGTATWVLSGGTTPNLAYSILANRYLTQLDWSKVIFVIGDERIGPLTGPDNNWGSIEDVFLQHVPSSTFLRPKSDLSPEAAAADYEERFKLLPQMQHDSAPRLDLVWLGLGSDGHTLSLFPGHTDFNPEDTRLVIPVHNSPKPPVDRISLTLHALTGSKATVVLATGENKRSALINAFTPGSMLPIALAAGVGNNTVWFLDQAATP